MESLLDSVHYLYNYHMVCALLSHTHHVMWPLWHPDIWPWYVTFVIWHLPTLLPCSKSKWEEKRKRKRKRKINNNLAVLPSHDTPLFGPKIHPSKSCYQHHYILYKGEVFWPDHGSYTHPPHTLPPFPDDVPTHPLLVVDYALLKARDQQEIDRLWEAATKIGFW